MGGDLSVHVQIEKDSVPSGTISLCPNCLSPLPWDAEDCKGCGFNEDMPAQKKPVVAPTPPPLTQPPAPDFSPLPVLDGASIDSYGRAAAIEAVSLSSRSSSAAPSPSVTPSPFSANNTSAASNQGNNRSLAGPLRNTSRRKSVSGHRETSIASYESDHLKMSFMVGLTLEPNYPLSDPPMEDYAAIHVVSGGRLFAAVYDGHDGPQAARMLTSVLHRHVGFALDGGANESTALRHSMLRCDREMGKGAVGSAGSTCTAVLFSPSGSDWILTVANVGDSRAVLFSTAGPDRLTKDHHATDPVESARIISLNGRIIDERVNGRLQLARSLGDYDLKPWVSPEPDVTSRVLTDADWALVICSDGVWDEVPDERVGAIISACRARGEDAAAMGDAIVRAAMAAGSEDNIASLVILFEKQ